MQKMGHFFTTSLLVACAATACSPNLGETPNETQVEITNVKMGLVCMYDYIEDGSYERNVRVCVETDRVQITGQGRCVYDGKTKPCTWYGYEFDYSNTSGDPVTMTCSFIRRPNAVLGNPDGVLDDSITSYEHQLNAGEGHISNPQYTLFTPSKVSVKRHHSTTCKIGDSPAFEIKFEIVLPNQP